VELLFIQRVIQMRLLQQKPRLLLLITLLAYSLLYLVWIRPLNAIQVVDFWGHMRTAGKMSLGDPTSLLHPFYPVGYFAVLRLGLESGIDMARYGQLVSWAGSAMFLAAIFGLLYQFTKNALYALLGAGLLIAHPLFRFHAMREGTDMLAAGLALGSLYFLAAGARRDGNWKWLVAAGVTMGGAYLIRYTSLVFLPVAVFFLLLDARRINKRVLISIGIYGLAFAIIIAPQVVLSLRVTGTPFFNALAKNVWFGMYGQFNFTDNWSKIPEGVTIAQVVRGDPAGFFRHWFSEFGRFLLYEPVDANDQLAIIRNVTLWNPLILHFFWLASCVLLWFDRRLTVAEKALLTMALFVPVLAASMAWLYTRFLLIALGIQVTLIMLALSQIGQRVVGGRYQRVVTFGLAIVLVALLLVFTGWTAAERRVREMTERIGAMNETLAAVGARKTSDVITNNLLYQSLADSGHERYEVYRGYGNDSTLTLPEMLAESLGGRSSRFLAFDWSSYAIRTYDYAPYQNQLLQDKDLLVPLEIGQDHSLFCLYPCLMAATDEVLHSLYPGFELLGFDVFLNPERTLAGIYLYWRAVAQSEESYLIRLQLLDGQGEVVAEDIGRPQLGTYPTASWPVGARIIDYHQLAAPAIETPESYRLRISIEGEDGMTLDNSVVEVPLTLGLLDQEGP